LKEIINKEAKEAVNIAPDKPFLLHRGRTIEPFPGRVENSLATRRAGTLVASGGFQ
jgi:hypothetical protein